MRPPSGSLCSKWLAPKRATKGKPSQGDGSNGLLSPITASVDRRTLLRPFTAAPEELFWYPIPYGGSVTTEASG
jgi:hypothetical protein